MKRLLLKKRITAILFFSFIMIFSVFNIYNLSQGQVMKAFNFNLIGDFRNIKEVTQEIEGIVNENIFQKYKFIESYGYLQRLMGKSEVANYEVVKDTEGKLHYTYFAKGPNETDHLVKRMKKLKEKTKNTDAELIYLMTPDKYIEGHTEFPMGIPYNYANETANDFLRGLEQEGISYIDLRTHIKESGIPLEELFFSTDHHWQIQTAFWAFTQVVEELDQRYGLNLDEDKFYTDISNYNVIEYKDSYIGSMGRKVGKYYAGVDDFTLIYPKFKTNYEFDYESLYNTGTLSGRFEEALLAVPSLNEQEDIYGMEHDKYFTYLYGNHPIAHIQNKQVKDGLKIAFVKDSMAVPIISFLSTICSDIYILDPRYYKEDIGEYLSQQALDFIFVSYYPQNLVEEFFPF